MLFYCETIYDLVGLPVMIHQPNQKSDLIAIFLEVVAYARVRLRVPLILIF